MEKSDWKHLETLKLYPETENNSKIEASHVIPHWKHLETNYITYYAKAISRVEEHGRFIKRTALYTCSKMFSGLTATTVDAKIDVVEPVYVCCNHRTGTLSLPPFAPIPKRSWLLTTAYLDSPRIT